MCVMFRFKYIQINNIFLDEIEMFSRIFLLYTIQRFKTATTTGPLISNCTLRILHNRLSCVSLFRPTPAFFTTLLNN